MSLITWGFGEAGGGDKLISSKHFKLWRTQTKIVYFFFNYGGIYHF